ncbi:MAG: serine/threonine protein kinase [Gammaproteobacteria bacterium]|nr:serine/threonine protein kinase [Gammaproteobacteria bacterium]
MPYKTPLSIRLRSLSGLLLVLALLLAAGSTGLKSTACLDTAMFSAGQWILPQSDRVDNIQLIQVPDNLIQDPEQVSQLRQLLKKLNRSKSAVTAFITPQTLFADYQRKEDDKKATAEETEADKWEMTQGELTKLVWTLDRYSVLSGVAVSLDATLPVNVSTMLDLVEDTSVMAPVVAFFMPAKSEMAIASQAVNYTHLPFYYSAGHKLTRPLIWYDASVSKLFPDLLLETYARYLKNKTIDWQQQSGVLLDGNTLHTNPAGYILNYPVNHNAADILSLEEALNTPASSFSKKVILIGSDKNQLQQLQQGMSNLLASKTYYSPQWSYWLKIILLVLAFAYALYLLPRLQKHTATLLTLFIVFALLVAQYGLLLTQGAWMAWVALYLFIITAHIIVRVDRKFEARLNHSSLGTYDALWRLGQYQFEQGDHDKAMPTLLKCKPTTDVLELLYEIGLGFERRRQYDKALQVYSEIEVRKADFKDIQKRLQTLTNVSGTKTEVIGALQGSKTLVMPELDLQLPVLGRYEIERELGRGAMGVVYLGRDPKINRQVAIKTLDYSQLSKNEIKSIKSRFFREAEAAGRLNHPNIVTVYDVGDEEDFAFIAMDYVPGVSLSEFTKKEKLLPVNEVYRISKVVAETLAYAHEQKIVHRDIKPSNIMYDPKTGQVKVADFGIARITDSVKTRTGSFLGSPSYMAPEQMTGNHVDGRADIYSLGVSFYQLLTGILPFNADSLGNLAYKITHEKHRPIRDVRSDLPSSATRIVNKALQKDPDKRYATGKEMAEALNKAMPGDGGQ